MNSNIYLTVLYSWQHFWRYHSIVYSVLSSLQHCLILFSRIYYNVYICCVGFTAEDMANMTGQYAASQLLSDHSMKLRRSAGGSSLAGSITPRDTPRGSVGPSSASTTPRDPSLTNMLPVDNNDRG